MTSEVVFTEAEHRIFAERERLTVSQWAEKYRQVEQGPHRGQWTNTRTPYLIKPMDTLNLPWVQKVILQFAPQTGKTQVLLNFMAFCIDQQPGPMMYIMPDEGVAKRISRRRIRPMIKQTPRIASLLSGSVNDITTRSVTFKNGMDLMMGWAGSAAVLASESARYMMFDEVDKYPTFTGKEADPLSLGEVRTIAYPYNRKLLYVSTPTNTAGYIHRLMTEQADEVWQCTATCPVCKRRQRMDFERIKWPGDIRDSRIVRRKKLAHYKCEECGKEWDDSTRNRAVALSAAGDDNGWQCVRLDKDDKWVPTDPIDRPLAVGFHMPSWYSPFVSLSDAAAAFLDGQNDSAKFMAFVTQHKAEAWVNYQAAREEEPILQLIEDRPRGVVPSEQPIAGITAGIDTQDDGFWYWIHAWGLAEPGQRPRSWCVRAGFVLTFDDLAQVLWEDAHRDITGKQYVIEMALQDSAGHRTSEVYDFARAHPGRLFPALGRKTMNSPYRWNPQTHYPGAKRAITGRALQLLNVNTKYWKDDAAAALQVGPGDPGGIGLYADFPAEYVAHLVAEYVGEDGFWECPSSRANHLWDCFVLNFVAAEVRGVRHRGRPAAPVGAPAAGGRRVISRGVEI